MKRVIDIGDLLIPHRMTAQQLMGADEGLNDAKHLFAWILRAGNPSFTRTDCLRANHGRFKEKKRLDLALTTLGDRRIITRRNREETLKAGRPAEVYDISPLIFSRKR